MAAEARPSGQGWQARRGRLGTGGRLTPTSAVAGRERAGAPRAAESDDGPELEPEGPDPRAARPGGQGDGRPSMRSSLGPDSRHACVPFNVWFDCREKRYDYERSVDMIRSDDLLEFEIMNHELQVGGLGSVW